jgi:hypothetical protein
MDSIIMVQEEPRGPSQLVEVIIDVNARSKFPFPDQQQLRSLIDQNVIVKGMRLITSDVLANGPITGAANATLAELQKISLVIYAEGWEKATNMPVLPLNDVATPAGTFPYRDHATRFNNWARVDWSKSYILFSNGSGGAAGAPYCLMLDVEYQKLGDDGAPIIGPS